MLPRNRQTIGFQLNEGVLIDFDGTLCASTEGLIAALAQLRSNLGISQEQLREDALDGVPVGKVPEIIDRMRGFRDVDQDAIQEYLRAVAMVYETAPPARGARQLIESRLYLSITIIVVTSNLRNVFSKWAALNDLDVSNIQIVDANSVQNHKPAPDPYLFALRSAALNPDRCIAIEDSRNGALASTSAGLTTLTLHDFQLPGTRPIQDLREALTLLEAGAP